MKKAEHHEKQHSKAFHKVIIYHGVCYF